MDSAQDIFQKYAKEMTAKEREDCAAKIRLCAADLHARSLWERAASETDGSPQQRETWALAQLNEEKNSDLKTDVEENLTLLRAAAQTQEHLQQAQLYHSVAVSHNGEAQSKVAAQTLLDPYQMRLARRAALETDRGILGSAHPEKFNQLYFSDSEKEILNAYEKNQISAKEYCLLQAVRHERAAGQETGQCRLLSKGIDLWSEKKGLSQQDAQFVKYAVLSADGGIENQLDAWQRIKTLFDI